MTNDRHKAMLEYLWTITSTDKVDFCATDIKIHTIKDMFNEKDFKMVRYSVIFLGKFKKHSFVIKIEEFEKIELVYMRDRKLDSILDVI